MGAFKDEFIRVSRESGKKYGYPQCCIDEFCNQPPSYFEDQHPEDEIKNKTRWLAAQFNGKFSGFIPCYVHAKEILSGKIKLHELVSKTPERTVPFPYDWSFQ